MTRGLFWIRLSILPLACLGALLAWREIRAARSIPAPSVYDAGLRSPDGAVRAPLSLPRDTHARRISPNAFIYGADPAGGEVRDPDVPADRGLTGLRLAGTFLAYGGGRAGIDRIAVIETAEAGHQETVTVGDELAGVTVTEISRDRVALRERDGTIRFLLAFDEGRPRRAPEGAETAGLAGDWENVDPGTLVYPVSPFRRVINRDAVLALQEEILRDPAEIARVLALAQPVQGPRGLEGYRLGSLGNQELITAFGLAPGDVVRKVNSVELTAPQRAEYFYREFMRDELTALVLEIDRGGVTTNLIFSIR